MRHIGILAGAAASLLTPGVASAQMGAPAGAPMQPGGWSQGGWQAGGTAAPTFEPGASGYASQGYTQGYAPQGYAQPRDWRGDHAMRDHGDYRHLSRGKRLPDAYMDPRYAVSDWAEWGFATPAPGTHWIRYYDDGLLVDGGGRIVDTRYGVDWDRGRREVIPGYMRGGYAGGAGYGYPVPGSSSYRAGPNTVVTTIVVPTPPPVIVGAPAYGYGYRGGYYGGGAQIVSVTPGVAVTTTTTTTTTDYETVYKSVAVRKRVWRRPIRHYHPRCIRATSCPVQGS